MDSVSPTPSSGVDLEVCSAPTAIQKEQVPDATHLGSVTALGMAARAQPVSTPKRELTGSPRT